MILRRYSSTNFGPMLKRKWIKFTFSKSQGAGGQHVNTTSSRVDARIRLKDASWMDDGARSHIFEMFSHLITRNSGELVVTSQKSRSQASNIDDCIEKLQSIVDSAYDASRESERRDMRQKYRATRLLNSEPRSDQSKKSIGIPDTKRRRRKKQKYTPMRQGRFWVWRTE